VAVVLAPAARSRMIAALAAILQSATPLIYVALGGMIAARAGIWNLGLEGLMIAGACVAVVGTQQTSSVGAGLALAIVVCVLGSALLWFAIEKLRANPVIAGLGLSGLGLGGSDLAIQTIYGNEGSVHVPFGLPQLGAGAGEFAGCSVLVVAMPFVVVALWVLLRRTRFGLRLSACGEHPFAARSVGVDPSRMRLIALALGGVLCALGGAELALGRLQIFSVGMTAGRGYMAFAAVSFGAMNPVGSALAAAFFSVVEYLGIKGQLAFGNLAPPELILSLPYLATVLGVWLSSRLRGGVATISELREY
jgi:simple sugar transport system permease protein